MTCELRHQTNLDALGLERADEGVASAVRCHVRQAK